MRRMWVAALAVVLAGSSACSDDADTRSSKQKPGVNSEGMESPPGGSIAAGLVIPVGTRLVGPVFSQAVDPTRPTTSRTWVVLEIDGDPFAAWDDLAGQAQAIGVALPRSGICWWRHAMPEGGEDMPVTEPRPQGARALDCQANARGPTSRESQISLGMRLWWWSAGAELHLEIIEAAGNDLPDLSPMLDPGPAPVTAAGDLPERDDLNRPGVGEAFGRENNCFEAGYGRLTLPSGAELVGGGTTPGLSDFAAVLAVEDAHTVLQDLLSQLDEAGDPDGTYTLDEHRLPDGSTVWSLDGHVSGGGGACGMWSSADGHAVLVTTSSD